MKLLSCYGLGFLALATFVAPCEILKTTAYEDGSTLCGVEGSGAAHFIARTYPAIPSTSTTYCADMCVRDTIYCKAFSIDTSSGFCTTYAATLNSTDIQAGKTGTTFYNVGCFKQQGDCGIVNGGWEATYPGGTPQIGRIRAGNRPLLADARNNSVQIAPWSFSQNSFSRFNYIEVVSNADSDHPTPYGTHYLKMHLLPRASYQIYQTTSQLPNTNYTITFAYNFMRFTHADTPSNRHGNYQFSFAAGGCCFASTPVLDPLTDVDGKWHLFTANITTRKSKAETEPTVVTFGIGHYAAYTNKEERYDNTAEIGIDMISAVRIP